MIQIEVVGCDYDISYLIMLNVENIFVDSIPVYPSNCSGQICIISLSQSFLKEIGLKTTSFYAVLTQNNVIETSSQFCKLLLLKNITDYII